MAAPWRASACRAKAAATRSRFYISRLRPRLEGAGLLIRTVRGFGYRLEHAQERRDGAD